MAAVLRRLLIEIFLESSEEAANVFRPAQIGDGVGNRVLVF
jgi:hypothetical protein